MSQSSNDAEEKVKSANQKVKRSKSEDKSGRKLARVAQKTPLSQENLSNKECESKKKELTLSDDNVSSSSINDSNS